MSEEVSNLLFSFNKVVNKPSSCVGKVWLIQIKNGVLSVGDSIRISPVNLVNLPREKFFDVKAVVKTLRNDLRGTIEGKQEIDVAHTGNIVGLDIRDCYCGSSKIHKKDISILKTSIGFRASEQLDYYSDLYIQYSDLDTALDIMKEGQHISLLIFGNLVQARVIRIDDSLEGMYVKLLYGRKLAVPLDLSFRNSELIRKVVMRVEHKGRFRYTSGFFNFNL